MAHNTLRNGQMESAGMKEREQSDFACVWQTGEARGRSSDWKDKTQLAQFLNLTGKLSVQQVFNDLCIKDLEDKVKKLPVLIIMYQFFQKRNLDLVLLAL
jgi:hypothetical protein